MSFSLRPSFIRPWHLLLPVVIAAATAPVWLRWYEPGLFYFLNRQLAFAPDRFWAFFCLLGTGWCAYALTAPLLLKAPHVFMAWLCTAPFAGIFTRMGKAMADNLRPLGVLEPQTVHVIGEPLYLAAMPSGHTMTTFALATAIFFSLPAKGRWVHLWLFLIAMFVALARVAVGAHWPADVSVAAAAGVLSGLIGAWLASQIPDRWLKPHTWTMRAVALIGVYSIYVLVFDPMGFTQNMPIQYLLAAFLLINLMSFSVHSFRKPFPRG